MNKSCQTTAPTAEQEWTVNDMRLIDADALFKEFEKAAWYNNMDRDGVAEEFLLLMPAIDAVPVVRCKDCIRCDEERTLLGTVFFCDHWVRNTESDGYCHEGFAKGW